MPSGVPSPGFSKVHTAQVGQEVQKWLLLSG